MADGYIKKVFCYNVVENFCILQVITSSHEALVIILNGLEGPCRGSSTSAKRFLKLVIGDDAPQTAMASYWR